MESYDFRQYHPPFPSSTNPFNERFLPVIFFLCRNYLGNQITRFTGRTMDQFKKENMKTLTLCISCVFPPDSLSFLWMAWNVRAPPLGSSRFWISVWCIFLFIIEKLISGVIFHVVTLPYKKIQKCCADECPLIKIMQIHRKKKLRRMFDINKTHVVATTVSMLIHDTAGYKCKQCEKPRVPIHLVGMIEVCLIK